MIIIRIDPQTNQCSYDEPLSDTLIYQGASFRDAIEAAIDCLRKFADIMDEQGILNFNLSKP